MWDQVPMKLPGRSWANKSDRRGCEEEKKETKKATQKGTSTQEKKTYSKIVRLAGATGREAAVSGGKSSLILNRLW